MATGVGGPPKESVAYLSLLRCGLGTIRFTSCRANNEQGHNPQVTRHYNAQMSGLAAPSDRTYSHLRILLSVYFLTCVIWFVAHSAHWKLVNDAAQIHYVCFLMDHGMAPYRDILEINWPGTYVVNWSVMHTLGAGAPAWRIFDLTLMGVSCWAMVAIAAPYDWFAGVFGAALFILYHGRDGAGQEGQRDLIIAVLLLCAYAFLFASFRSRRMWPLFAFAVCAGAAATIKPTPLPFVLLLLVVAAMRPKRAGEPILKPTLCMLLGLLIPLAVVGAFLICEHSLAAFWSLMHEAMPFYHSLGAVSFPTLMALIATPSVMTLALLALSIAVIKRDWWNWEGKMLIAGILFGIASYLGQGKSFPYHRYPMLAFLFLWAGLQMVSALRSRGMVRALGMIGVGLAVILAPIYVKQSIHRVWDTEFTDSLTADLRLLAGHPLSGHVQCIYVPSDCDTALYQTRLVQSTGLLYDYLIFGSAQQQVIRDVRERFWQQFQRNTPQVVIVGGGLFPDGRGYEKLASWPLFEQELASHYVLFRDRTFRPNEYGPRAYRIYVEKDTLPLPPGPPQ